MKNTILLLLLFPTTLVLSQKPVETICLNQIGFYPGAPKEAVLSVATPQQSFQLKDAGTGKMVFTGSIQASTGHAGAEAHSSIDFSGFRKPGNYYLEVPGMGRSYSFEIKKDVHRSASVAALKGFYFQRTRIALTARYAGKWARAAGHPDTEVYVHASAASAERPEGTVIASPLGWYDAGDYNKYIVNSGISVATLLSFYEDFPGFSQDFRSDIPESGNGLPDVLNEALFNIRWMLSMQDPNDGGVYHKLTNARFDGMNVTPDKAISKRYVVQKSVTAALDFAAVMAQSSRIFRPFEKTMPHFADSCLVAAEKAWQWAKGHSDALYRQSEMNKRFKPEINTGEYGDNDAGDEWIWAAAELWATTQKDVYRNAVNLFPDDKLPLPAWDQVRLLGYYTLIRFQAKQPAAWPAEIEALKHNLLREADNLAAGASTTPFHTVMGRTDQDYIWGSNAVAANQGILLIQAYHISKDKKYLKAALTNLDYLLGRNATGYCFLTGFGQKQVMHPHHRPSISDGIVEPVPGLLSGGPNAGRQDKCPGYPSTLPAKSYLDDDCSYASNEIAINWNAPMVYLAGAMEALQGELGK
jgi:endoglucanase